jgi:hypothetical protein
MLWLSLANTLEFRRSFDEPLAHRWIGSFRSETAKPFGVRHARLENDRVEQPDIVRPLLDQLQATDPMHGIHE